MVPATSPLRRSADIQIGLILEQLERKDEAVKQLEDIVAERPKDIEALIALGNIYRVAQASSRRPPRPTRGRSTPSTKAGPGHWSLFYFRGIAYERTKQWPKAEADFRKALELYPDQPHGAELSRLFLGRPGHEPRRGLQDAEQAVELRPTTATSSTAWAGPITGSATTTKPCASWRRRSS